MELESIGQKKVIWPSDISSGGTEEGKETAQLLKDVSNTQNKGHELKDGERLHHKGAEMETKSIKNKTGAAERAIRVSRIKKKKGAGSEYWQVKNIDPMLPWPNRTGRSCALGRREKLQLSHPLLPLHLTKARGQSHSAVTLMAVAVRCRGLATYCMRHKRGKRVTQHPGQRCLCSRKGFRPGVRHNGRTAMVTGSRSGGERDREGKASNAGKNVLSKEQFPCILSLPPILPLLCNICHQLHAPSIRRQAASPALHQHINVLTCKVHVSLLAGNMLCNERASQQEEHNLRANYLGRHHGIKWGKNKAVDAGRLSFPAFSALSWTLLCNEVILACKRHRQMGCPSGTTVCTVHSLGFELIKVSVLQTQSRKQAWEMFWWQ